MSKAQAGIKIAGRNSNNLRYADDTTLMTESEEELKSLLMKVKEKNENVCLKLSIQKTKIMASSPIHFMTSRWGNNGNSERLFSWTSKSLQIVTAVMKLKRHLILGRKAITNLDKILKSRDITLPTKSI